MKGEFRMGLEYFALGRFQPFACAPFIREGNPAQLFE